MAWHQIEVYWGSEEEQLYHTTMGIWADDVDEAIETLMEFRLRPADFSAWHEACAKEPYGPDYYDAIPLPDELE